MNKDILNTAILAASFLGLFATAEILFHFAKIKAELTRKLVHFGTGILTLLFPILLSGHWPVLFLCASFAVILVLSLRFNLLRSINAIDRESVGSIAYPVSVFGCFLMYEFHDHTYIFFYMPILVLAICDPLAALCGKRWPIGKYKVGSSGKTFLGSFMFFASCAILCGFLLYSSHHYETEMPKVLLAILIAVVATITEAVSGRGYDNITIPASVLLVMKLAWTYVLP